MCLGGWVGGCVGGVGGYHMGTNCHINSHAVPALPRFIPSPPRPAPPNPAPPCPSSPRPTPPYITQHAPSPSTPCTQVKAYVLDTIASDPGLQQTELVFLGLFGRACRVLESAGREVRGVPVRVGVSCCAGSRQNTLCPDVSTRNVDCGMTKYDKEHLHAHSVANAEAACTLVIRL